MVSWSASPLIVRSETTAFPFVVRAPVASPMRMSYPKSTTPNAVGVSMILERRS
jgi:hypothetical protein